MTYAEVAAVVGSIADSMAAQNGSRPEISVSVYPDNRNFAMVDLDRLARSEGFPKLALLTRIDLTAAAEAPIPWLTVGLGPHHNSYGVAGDGQATRLLARQIQKRFGFSLRPNRSIVGFMVIAAFGIIAGRRQKPLSAWRMPVASAWGLCAFVSLWLDHRYGMGGAQIYDLAQISPLWVWTHAVLIFGQYLAVAVLVFKSLREPPWRD